VQRKQAEREAAMAADAALIAESRRIMDLREQQRKDEMQRRADKIQVRLGPAPERVCDSASALVHEKQLYSLLLSFSACHAATVFLC
jgi:hypothetical protein